jgi:hypothetical protein
VIRALWAIFVPWRMQAEDRRAATLYSLPLQQKFLQIFDTIRWDSTTYPAHNGVAIYNKMLGWRKAQFEEVPTYPW